MNTHHPAGVDGSINTPLATPKELQVIPGYQYPFSLRPENLPEVFYRLHRDENWRDIHSPPPTNSLLCEPYSPPEHGWSAKDTHSPLPSSPKQILSLVRKHFSENSASQPPNSIFVPGVWRAGKSSQVSLWDDIDDAREEATRIGGVDIIDVNGEVLREGKSVVFCLEELLGRSSALCWATRGRYGRRGGEGENKRGRKWVREGRRGGKKLRGKAYLVVGVIPGTHNFSHPTPVIPTTNTNNTNHAFHMQSENKNIIKEEIARHSLLSSISMNDRTTCGTFGDFDFGLEREQGLEMEQATPLSQTPKASSDIKYPKSHETNIDSELVNWTLENSHVNNIQKYEIERDIRRHAQGMKRNSAFKRMEKISEDIGNSILVDTEFENEVEERKKEGEEDSLQGMDGEGSRGWSWGDDRRGRGRESEREMEKGKMNDFNSERKITSTARITRKGTFGERFKGNSADLRDKNKASLQGQSSASRDSTRRDSDGGGRVERTRYVDTGTSTRSLISREEYSSEESLSADEGIPAVAVAGSARKRGTVCEAQGTSERSGENDGDVGAGDGNVYFESVGMDVGVGRKKSRRNEDDRGYRNRMGKEREEISFSSHVSSFVGTVNDDKDIEGEDADEQDMDTNLDIDIPGRGKIPDPRTNANSTANSRIPIEYLKSRRPIPQKTISRDNTRGTYFENDEDTGECGNEIDKEELFDLDSGEGVKNDGSEFGLGTQGDVNMVRRDMNEKRGHKEVTNMKYSGTSRSGLPISTSTIGFPSRTDGIPKTGGTAHLPQSKRISTSPLSPSPCTLISNSEIQHEIETPKRKNKNEILYPFKSVLALCTRLYNNIPKQCYLIEWEDPWAPTWQVKSETDGIVGEVWRRNKQRWERGARERGRMERIVWEEEEEEGYVEGKGKGKGKGTGKGEGKAGKEGRYLIEWEKDSRPEWMEKREVSRKLVDEFEKRRRRWRVVDEGEREYGGR